MKEKGSKWLFFLPLAVILIAGIVILVFSIIGNSFSKSIDYVLKTYKEGILNMDAELIAKVIHPKFISTFEDMSGNTYTKELQSALDSIEDDVVDYEIDNDYYTPTKIEALEFKDELEETYGISSDSVEELRLYTANIIAKEENGDYDEWEDEFVLLRINDSWYLYHDEFVDDLYYYNITEKRD